jgi:hypothetical protein
MSSGRRMKTERKLEIAERLPNLIRCKFTHPGGPKFAWETHRLVPAGRQGKEITTAEWERMDDKPARQPSNEPYTYLIEWEQRTSLFGATNMNVESNDPQTIHFLWRELFTPIETDWIRNVRFSYKKPRARNYIPFDPLTQGIPRPPRV